MKKIIISSTIAAITLWLSPIEYELSISDGKEIISIKKYILTIPIEIEQEPSPFIGVIDGLIMASKWKLISPIQIFKPSEKIPFRTISITTPNGATKQLLAGDSYFIPPSTWQLEYSSFKDEHERLYWIAASLDKMIDISKPTDSEQIKIENISEIINAHLSKAQRINYKFDQENNYKPLSLALKDGIGDCKVKVTYLKHLLTGINVKSEYVLTSLDIFRTSNDASIAIPKKYNHVILYLPDYGIYLDPTNNESKFDILPGVLQWRSGVNLSSGKEIEISNTKPDLIENTVSIGLNNNKEIIVRQTLKATGYYGYTLSEAKINNYSNSVKDITSYVNGEFQINRTYVTTDFKEPFGKIARDIAMMKKLKGDVCNYNASVSQEIKISPDAEKILWDKNINFNKKKDQYKIVLKNYECPVDIAPMDTIIKKKY